MKVTNSTGLPSPLFLALEQDDYDSGNSDITATGLLQPPHLAALERLHAAALTEDVSDLARILIGKAVHAYIARTATGELDDKRRLFVRYGGWLVSGQTDHVFTTANGGGELLTEVNHTVTDYKSVSVWEYMRGLRLEREQQLNIYAELLRANGIAVSALSACLIFVDWSPRRARYEKDYPPASIVDVEIPLWPQAEAQAFIAERVAAHQAARADVEATTCSDEERWASGGQWAVIRSGNKRASKLFDNDALAEAEAYAASLGPAFRVESREREYGRCAWYCRAAPFCAQFAADPGGST